MLTVDVVRNWMLTADFGPVRRFAEPARVLHAYAEMIPAFTGIQ